MYITVTFESHHPLAMVDYFNFPRIDRTIVCCISFFTSCTPEDKNTLCNPNFPLTNILQHFHHRNTQPHLQCPKPLRCHKSPIDSEILFLSININLLILLENIKLKKFKSTTSSPSLSQPVGHLYISL